MTIAQVEAASALLIICVAVRGLVQLARSRILECRARRKENTGADAADVVMMRNEATRLVNNSSLLPTGWLFALGLALGAQVIVLVGKLFA